MSEQTFERLLQRTLLEDGQRAVRPFDAAAIAASASSSTRSRRQVLRTLAPYAVAALIGAAFIAGAVLLSGGRPTPPPPSVISPSRPATASPPSSPAADVPAAMIGKWMGAAPAVPGPSGARHTALLDVDASGLWLTDRSEPGQTQRFLASVDGADAVIHLRATSLGECPAAASDGSYAWSMSPGGSTLEVRAIEDSCTRRIDALAGTWYRMGCAAWGSTCIGHLERGTYPSWNFAAATDATSAWNPVIGGLTYTVPDGWTNSHDFQAGYWLEPTAWLDDLLTARGNVDNHDRPVGNGIYVMSGPVAALQDEACSTGVADPTVGENAADLLEFLTHHPALEASEATPVLIGGLPGSMVDVRLKPTWTRSCPGMTMPVASLFTFRNGSTNTVWNDAATVGAAADRYIVLDLGEGRPVVIQISTPSPAALEQLLPSAMPIVETFRFQP